MSFLLRLSFSRHGKGKSLRKRIKASFRRKTSKNGGNKEDDKDQQQPDGSDAVSEGGGAKRGGARKKSSSVSINPTPSIINPQGEGEGIAVSATAPSTPKTPARSQKVPQARCGSPSGSGASSNQKSSTKTMMGVKRTHLTVEDAENRL